ncbi:MAG: phosphomethylpyrimidine synthase ThiC [Proteobacteria bacterium]|nr:phosphomethylpyrimidine synthase ThiC [Pseudomonadota bacterium]
MKTQLELAKEGTITGVMAEVARDEGFSVEEIRLGVAAGHIVIPCNPSRPTTLPQPSARPSRRGMGRISSATLHRWNTWHCPMKTMSGKG